MATAQPAPTSKNKTSSTDRYQQAVEKILTRTASMLKTADFFCGLLLLGSWILGFFLLVAIVDAWVIPLNSIARLVALAIFLAGILYCCVRWIVPLVLCRINPMYAAKVIEDGHPKLKNSLLNYVSFLTSSNRTSIRKGVMEAISKRAAIDASRIPGEQAIDYTGVIRILYVLTLLLAAFALYWVFSPRSPLPTVMRLLSPMSALAPPTRVSIENIDPQFGSVFLGDPLVITAQVDGLGADEKPVIVYDTADSQAKGAVAPMLPVEDQFHMYQCELRTGDQGIQKDVTFRVVAGDATSQPYRIAIIQRPTIILDQIDVEFPVYTEMPQKTLKGQGDLQIVAGTKLHFKSHSNSPMKRAWIEFYDLPAGAQIDPKQTLRVIRSKLDLDISNDTQATGQITTELGSGGVPRYNHYRLRMIDQKDNAAQLGPLYRIDVRPDLPPDVAILFPQASEYELALDQKLDIRFQAIDPDYQLTRVFLSASSRSGKTHQQPVDLSSGGHGLVTDSWTFDPMAMGLEPGDQVTVYVQAEDNRHTPPRFSLDPNIVRTNNLTLTISQPLDADQADQAQEAASPDQNQQVPPDSKPDQADPNANQNSATDNRPADQQKDQQAPENTNQDPSAERSSDDQANGRDEKTNAEGNRENRSERERGELAPTADGNSNDNAAQPTDEPNDTAGADTQKKDGDSNREATSPNDSQPDRDQLESGAAGDGANNENSQESSNAESENDELEAIKQAWREQAQENTDQPQHDGEVMDQIREFIEQEEGKSPPNDNLQNQPADQGQQQGQQQPGQQQGQQEPGQQEPGQLEPGQQQPGQQQPGQQQPGQQQPGQQQPGQQQPGQQQPGQQQPGQQQPGQQQPGQQQPGQQQPGQQQPGQQQPGQQQPGQQQPGQQQPGQQQPGQQQPGQQQPGQQQPGQQQPGQQQPGQQQPGQQQPGQQQPGQQQPGQQQPGQQQPGQQQPGQQQPGQQQPGQQQPGQQQPGQQQPGQQQPGQQQPGQQQPGQQEPGQQQPGQQQPGQQQPGQQQPGQQQPGQQQPGQQQPGQGQPGQGQPGQGQPGQGQPGQGQPGQGQPGQGQPGQGQPGQGQPGQGQPGQGQPGQGQPGQGQPGQGQPGQGQPGQGQPGQGQPGQGQPGQGQPGQGQPGQGQPGQGQPGQGQPGQGQPGQGQPGQGQPGQGQPGQGQPGQGQPGQGQPGQGQPGQGQPGQGQPGQGQPGQGQPGQGQPGQSAGSGGEAGNSSGRGSRSDTPGQGGEGGADSMGPSTGDEANLQYAEETTDLVLKYLNDQENQPNPELLERLNWTKDDLRDFLDRWQEMKASAKEGDTESQEEFQRKLQSLGLKPRDAEGQTSTVKEDDRKGLRQDAERVTIPMEMMRSFKAFQKGKARRETNNQ